jgi:hypothetical protein
MKKLETYVAIYANREDDFTCIMGVCGQISPASITFGISEEHRSIKLTYVGTPDDILMKIYAYLVRKKVEYPQKYLAKYFRITQQSISRYLNTNSFPLKMEMIRKLVKLYNKIRDLRDLNYEYE